MEEASIEEIVAETPPEDNIDDIMEWVFGPEQDLESEDEDS